MLLDTSGLLCLHHKAEPFHDQASVFYKQARVRLTHSYILAEFVALANARRLPRLPALTYMTDLLENPDIETVWVDESLQSESDANRRQTEPREIGPLAQASLERNRSPTRGTRVTS